MAKEPDEDLPAPPWRTQFGSSMWSYGDMTVGQVIKGKFKSYKARVLFCKGKSSTKITCIVAVEKGCGATSEQVVSRDGGNELVMPVAINKTSGVELTAAWGRGHKSKDPKQGWDYSSWMNRSIEIRRGKVKAFGTMKDAVLITPGQEDGTPTGVVPTKPDPLGEPGDDLTPPDGPEDYGPGQNG